MVGILLLTHAPLGQAFIAAAAHVFRGLPERIEAIDVLADQDPLTVNALANAAIERLDDGSGILIITDIMGGTPCNCCSRLAEAGKIEVLAGASLPMLLRAITYRKDKLEVVVQMALAGGQSGVNRIDHDVRMTPD